MIPTMTPTVEKIRQSEVMAKLGILQKDIASLRDAILSPGLDWWKEGVAIYWSTEAADRFIAAREGKSVDAKPSFSLAPESEIQAKPATVTARVLKSCINQRFVYASLNGERITVDCGKKIASKIVGKVITARVDQIDGETKYFYAR